MSTKRAFGFDDPDLFTALTSLDDSALDELGFGVIGFGSDPEARVRRYNAFESRHSGLPRNKVLDLPLFETVAQCMNNFMIAQRFEDALASGASLDTKLDYVLTVRVKPTSVVLRLMAKAGAPLRYVAIQWPS